MQSTQRFPRSIQPVDCDQLDLAQLPPGEHRLRLALTEDGLSGPIRIPVHVYKGPKPGPTVGITAAVHGNEVNGIPTIHRLFRRLDPDDLSGTVVAAAPVNVPGYKRNTRGFSDGKDLNRAFPGKIGGTESSVYAYALMERLIRHFDYLLDLHTASFGRVNSLYIRADMSQPETAQLARVIRPQIVVHNKSGDGTLRGAAEERGIKSLTIEIGNPQRAQGQLVVTSSIGLHEALEHLGLVQADGEVPESEAAECSKSYWLYTDGGGLLEVFPALTSRVQAGQPVAQLLNEWGEVSRTYVAPQDGIVIGKATNPVAVSGSRILHLGVLGKVETALPG